MIDPCARLRCRLRYVPAMRRNVWIPRHIVRIDSDRGHGWQVRFDPQSKYFGDGAHGGPESAFDAAKDYLVSIYRPIPKNTSRKSEAGAIRVVRKSNGEWYAETTAPTSGRLRRFYIGKDHTRTPEKDGEAIERARAQRARWFELEPVPMR